MFINKDSSDHGYCRGCSEKTCRILTFVEEPFFYCEKCEKEMKESNDIVLKYIPRLERYLEKAVAHRENHAGKESTCECRDISTLLTEKEKIELDFHKSRLKEKVAPLKPIFDQKYGRES